MKLLESPAENGRVGISGSEQELPKAPSEYDLSHGHLQNQLVSFKHWKDMIVMLSFHNMCRNWIFYVSTIREMLDAFCIYIKWF